MENKSKCNKFSSFQDMGKFMLGEEGHPISVKSDDNIPDSGSFVGEVNTENSERFRNDIDAMIKKCNIPDHPFWTFTDDYLRQYDGETWKEVVLKKSGEEDEIIKEAVKEIEIALDQIEKIKISLMSAKSKIEYLWCD